MICWWFRNPACQLRLIVYPIVYRVLYILSSAGILNHQQHHRVQGVGVHSTFFFSKKCVGCSMYVTFCLCLCLCFLGIGTTTATTTWMSQEVSKRLGSVGYNPTSSLFHKQVITHWSQPLIPNSLEHPVVAKPTHPLILIKSSRLVQSSQVTSPGTGHCESYDLGKGGQLVNHRGGLGMLLLLSKPIGVIRKPKKREL